MPNGGTTSETHCSFVGCSGLCPPNSKNFGSKRAGIFALLDADQESGQAGTFDTSSRTTPLVLDVGPFPISVLDPVADLSTFEVKNFKVSVQNRSAKKIVALTILWKVSDAEGHEAVLQNQFDSLVGEHDINPGEYRSIEATQSVAGKSPIKSVKGEVAYVEFEDGEKIGGPSLEAQFTRRRTIAAKLLRQINAATKTGRTNAAIQRTLDGPDFAGNSIKDIVSSKLNAEGLEATVAFVEHNRVLKNY